MVLFNMISKSTFFRDIVLDYKSLTLISRKESDEQRYRQSEKERDRERGSER